MSVGRRVAFRILALGGALLAVAVAAALPPAAQSHTQRPG